MSDLLLEMTDITKRFPGVLAVDKARLDLRPGEVHCLVGENGRREVHADEDPGGS